MMILFPAQGNISSMRREARKIYDKYEKAKIVWNTLDIVLQEEFSKRMFIENNEDIPTSREVQLMTAAHSISILDIIEDYIEFKYVGGNSLGEFLALSACECLSRLDFFRILNFRGILMSEVDGAMITVIGCTNISSLESDIYISNYLADGCIVLSGTRDAIKKAKSYLNARKIIDLDVTGPFHSPLMKDAEEKFAHGIKDIKFSDAKVGLYTNTSCKAQYRGDLIKQDIINSISNKIYFQKVISQNNDFVLIGSESTSIVRNKKFISINTDEDIETLRRS